MLSQGTLQGLVSTCGQLQDVDVEAADIYHEASAMLAAGQSHSIGRGGRDPVLLERLEAENNSLRKLLSRSNDGANTNLRVMELESENATLAEEMDQKVQMLNVQLAAAREALVAHVDQSAPIEADGQDPSYGASVQDWHQPSQQLMHRDSPQDDAVGDWQEFYKHTVESQEGSSAMPPAHASAQRLASLRKNMEASIVTAERLAMQTSMPPGSDNDSSTPSTSIWGSHNLLKKAWACWLSATEKSALEKQLTDLKAQLAAPHQPRVDELSPRGEGFTSTGPNDSMTTDSALDLSLDKAGWTAQRLQLEGQLKDAISRATTAKEAQDTAEIELHAVRQECLRLETERERQQHRWATEREAVSSEQESFEMLCAQRAKQMKQMGDAHSRSEALLRLEMKTAVEQAVTQGRFASHMAALRLCLRLVLGFRCLFMHSLIMTWRRRRFETVSMEKELVAQAKWDERETAWTAKVQQQEETAQVWLQDRLAEHLAAWQKEKEDIEAAFRFTLAKEKNDLLEDASALREAVDEERMLISNQLEQERTTWQHEREALGTQIADATAAAEAAAVHVHETEEAQLVAVRQHLEQVVREDRLPGAQKFLKQVSAREALLSCKGALLKEAQRVALEAEGAPKHQAVQQLSKKGALLDAEAGKTLEPLAILTCAADEGHAYYLNQDLAVHEAPPCLYCTLCMRLILPHVRRGRQSACNKRNCSKRSRKPRQIKYRPSKSNSWKPRKS